MIEEVKRDETNNDNQDEPFVADESGNIVYEDSPEERDRKKATVMPMLQQHFAPTSESKSIFRPNNTLNSRDSVSNS